MTQNTATTISSWTPRRVVAATLAVMAIASAFWLLVEFRMVFFSLFIAIVLSTAVEPLIDFLFRRGLPRAFSIVLIAVISLLLVIVAILAIIPMMSSQWFTLTLLMRQGYESLHTMLMDSSSILLRRIAEQLPFYIPTTPTTPAPVSEQPTFDMVQRAISIGGSIINGLVLSISVLLLSGLWTLEGNNTTRFLLMAFPQPKREGIQEFIRDVEQKVGAYTRGLGLLSLIIGVMAGVAYAIIGLPNFLFLGAFAGLMEIVPLVGPLLGAVPAILVATSTAPDKIIWVIIATIVIQAVENNLIVPRVMDRAVGVNPVASLLAFIAFGSVFGFFGALLAIPLAAIVQLILRRFVFKSNPLEQSPPIGRSNISTIRYDVQNLVIDVRKQIRDKNTELSAREDSIEDSMEAIAADLDSILALTESEENRKTGENGSPISNGGRTQ